jgi:predicted RNase H-like HicB family nuclease
MAVKSGNYLDLPPLVSLSGIAYTHAMKEMAYVVYREDESYVAQCLNVDVSSFGATRKEAVANLKEAVELFFEGESAQSFTAVGEVNVGRELVDA